jgi:hypothetical protein
MEFAKKWVANGRVSTYSLISGKSRPMSDFVVSTFFVVH